MRILFHSLLGSFVFSLCAISLSAQLSTELTDRYVINNVNKYGLSKSDLKNWKVTDNYVSKHNGVNHVYYQQTLDGIPVEHALINVNMIENGEVLSWNSRFVSDLRQKAQGTQVLEAEEALQASLIEVGITPAKSINKLGQTKGVEQVSTFEAFGTIEKELITKLIYVVDETEQVKLCWVTFISVLKPEFHEWSVYVDAEMGDIVKSVDHVLHCSFGESQRNCSGNHVHEKSAELFIAKSTEHSSMIGNYTVFDSPVESPNHGGRTVVSDPADLTASPFGWHDTNGAIGAEYTITRGNNVYAQDDINGNNGFGSSPDGGAALNFNYTLDLSESPETNVAGAQNVNSSLTNLFYWCNIIHDMFYQYGFDEVSGNFQENNYGNGGNGGDFIIADGLDGSGSNNANFSTPADGGNGRMQMFLWSASGATTTFTVNAPGNVAGTYNAVTAQFGASDYAVTGDVVEVDDGSPLPSEGCNALTNASAIIGNIALIDRGNCQFGVKVLNAENAGAVAAIVCDNAPGSPISMGPGTDGASVTIPSIMISQADCITIRAELASLNITMEATAAVELDGSFDNGIIAHEYGHGISIRLTGGPSTSCLGNAEQAGEGWSDFFGLVMTHEAGDTRMTSRGIGTYATGQPITGGGIRPFPYTTDMTVNPATYNTISSVSVPHGVGSIFCTMLWDMYWDFIDEYGYDSDIYSGTGGNNIAIQLVIDGLKMQPCNPGFIDARDAILAADRINNDGANQCLIWGAFARRGLGFSASQGDGGNVNDGVEGYDLPNGVIIYDDNAPIEIFAGEEQEITGTATCLCEAKSNVILKHTVPAGMSILSTTTGTINGNEVSSNAVNLSVQQEMSISYLAKVDNCIVGSREILFEDDIEAADEFTSSIVNGAGTWVKSGSTTNSGANAWYGENFSTNSDYALTLNATIPIANTSVLSFYHRYATESSWDGGVVEISTNNGSTWQGVADKFISNGYKSSINGNAGTAIAGQESFTGASESDFGTVDFVETKINLASFIGSNILIRFRFASDSNTTGSGINGWVIDDVKIQDIPLLTINKEVTIAGVAEDSQTQLLEVDQLSQNMIFVDAASTGRTYGGDWENAMKSLQAAIDIAACNEAVSEVWVKGGTYKPTSTNDVDASFNLRTNSNVYGGFAGTETVLADRDPLANPTILSGSITGGNSIHVLSNENITNALIDGFSIQSGAAGIFSGGGAMNDGSTVNFTNCRFLDNSANTGGGMYNNSSIITLEDCFFFENTSTTNLGRVITNENTRLTILNSTIIDALIGVGGNSINNIGSSQISTEGVVEVKKEE